MSLYRHSLGLIRLSLIHNYPKINITERRNIKRWVAPTLKELYRRRIKAGPLPEQPRSTYLEWNYDAEIFAFGKRLNEDFNKQLLKQALTHRAYANLQEIKDSEEGGETKGKPDDNLEMIEEGDNIISRYIQERYNKRYPKGVVEALLSYLTSVEMLAHVGLHLGLKDLILTSEFPVEEQTIADTVKAVVCALKESEGLERCHLFLNDFLICQIHDKGIDDIWNPDRPYEYLERVAKEKGITELEPRLCNYSAMNTILANYQVGIYNQKKLLGLGWGESVEVAKNSAALNAIHNLYKLDM